MRIAAIDFGTVRIGLALSDERRILASPLPYILAGKSLPESAQAIQKALSPHFPTSILLGLPLHLNGQESPLSLQVRELAKQLETLTSISIILWDERLSTAGVERTLKDAQVNRKKRKEIVDSLTAASLLQNYLSFLQN